MFAALLRRSSRSVPRRKQELDSHDRTSPAPKRAKLARSRSQQPAAQSWVGRRYRLGARVYPAQALLATEARVYPPFNRTSASWTRKCPGTPCSNSRSLSNHPDPLPSSSTPADRFALHSKCWRWCGTRVFVHACPVRGRCRPPSCSARDRRRSWNLTWRPLPSLHPSVITHVSEDVLDDGGVGPTGPEP